MKDRLRMNDRLRMKDLFKMHDQPRVSRRPRLAAVVVMVAAVGLLMLYPIMVAAAPVTDPSGKPSIPPEQPTLLLYAFAEEGAVLESRMEIDSTVEELGRHIVHGRLLGQAVILAESGVGMTNAAMTAQYLIDQYDPARVLFSGIAGGIDSSVHIGDIVVCSTWVHHEYGYWGAEGFAHGPTDVWLAEADSLVELDRFGVDAGLFAETSTLAVYAYEFAEIGGYRPKVMVGGVGASGNSFIDSEEKRLWLSRTFGALVVDMESAAVVQVCLTNGVPCLVFRSASDLAGGSGSETARAQLREFFRVAAGNSAQIVMRYLSGL